MRRQTKLKEIYNLRKKDIPINFNQFNSVITDFHLLVSNEIVYNGDIYNSPLGSIKIIKKDRVFKKGTARKNWGESNKLKKELLDKGEKLYDPKTGEGKKWIIYHTEEVFYAWVLRNGELIEYNSNFYKFIPVRINARKLSTFVHSNETNRLIYETNIK